MEGLFSILDFQNQLAHIEKPPYTSRTSFLGLMRVNQRQNTLIDSYPPAG
jgi:hypothetical protein